MRSDRVFTNLTCNQNCRYCTSRSASDDGAFIATAAVTARIDAALHKGAQELVLTGGEPTMRGDLPLLVAHARARGAKSVVLETNATLVDANRARAYAKMGLGLARVNLAGWGDALDGLTRDRGGFRRTLRGLEALVAAGVPVEIGVVLVRSSLPLVARLPEALAVELGERVAMVRALVLRTPVDGPEPSELVSYEDAVEAILGFEAAARRAGIAVKMSPDSGPPPCVFPLPSKVAHLYSLTPGARLRDDHRQLPACAECQMSDRCSGLPSQYLDRHAAPPMKPITEDRVRRRLSLISTVEDQIARELVQPSRFEHDSGVVDEHVIRVNFQCNQSCRFCFVSTHLPAAEEAAVRKAIVDAGTGGKRVMLSGGEPTLNANLVDYVRLARANTKLPVGIQSNAIRLADMRLVDALVDAGLGEAFISLHGSTAEISDAITEAPGTFEKTILGIDNLHKRPSVKLILNIVIHERNAADLLTYVRMVAARWPRALVNISFVAPSSDVVPKDRAMIPRYADVLGPLSIAVAEAHRLGLQIGGFESMCGIPLCLVPQALSHFIAMEDLLEGFDMGEFVKTPACQACDLKSKCYGLRRGYLALHGDSELRPVVAGKPFAMTNA